MEEEKDDFSQDMESDPSLTKEDSIQNNQNIPANNRNEENSESYISQNSQDLKTDEILQENQQNSMSVSHWLSLMKWQANPFIFTINPSIRVGYRHQTERIMMALEERHKFLLVLGPTGSGKTTLLKWIETRLKNHDVIYVGKPPSNVDEIVQIFQKKYRNPWYAFWKNKSENIYQLPDLLNSKLKKKHLVLMIDESQEVKSEVLEWLRVLNDQISNMTILLSGLPVFEDQLRTNLETFAKRITAKIELLSLTKEETRELISKRIRSVGGVGNEFDNVSDQIYNYTGGFPREIIRISDELVNNAILRGTTKIEFIFRPGEQPRAPIAREAISMPHIERMTPMQKEILEMLSKKPLTPGQIADTLELEKYKSRQHAVRSVNNVMKAMFEEGMLERRKEEKAYVYSLAPRISTLFVKR